MSFKTLPFRCVVLSLLCTACLGVPTLTPTQLSWATAKWPDARAEELERGRSLYVTRCSSCHAAPAPQEVLEHPDGDMVKEMADRAKLSADEQQAVLRFLEAVSSPGKSGVAQR